MPKETRAELHERFAAWLETRARDRLREYEEFVGYHLEQAHRYRSELGPLDDHGRQLAARAGELLGGAGVRAGARGDSAAAVNLLSRAVALLPPEAPERVRLLPDLVDSLHETAQFERAQHVLDEAMPLATRLGERRAELHIRMRQIFQSLATDPTVVFAGLLEEAQIILGEAETLEDKDILVEAQYRVASLLFWMGRSKEAEELAERAITQAREQNRLHAQAFVLYRGLFSTATWGSTPVGRGLARWRGILAEASGALEAYAHCTLGPLHAMAGDHDRARAHMDRAATLFQEYGMTLNLAAGHPWALVEELAGDPGAVEARIRPGIEILRAAGETGFMSTSAGHLADALYAQGRYDEAMEFTRLGEENAASDDVASQMQWRAVRAKAYAKLGKLQEAEALAREGVAVADRTDHLNLRGDNHVALAIVLAEAGRNTEAADEMRVALRLYEEKGNVVSAGRARQFLEELASEG